MIIREEGSEVVTEITENGMFIEHLCKPVAFKFDAKETLKIGMAIMKMIGKKQA